jgi:hypothetical protein
LLINSGELLGCGTKKVYAGARNPDGIDLPGVVPVKMDVTDPASVNAAAARCGDVTRESQAETAIGPSDEGN